jgi:hypothetical protein
MRAIMLQYAVSAGVGGMLALAAATGSLEQLQAGVHAANQLTQYCAPAQEDSEAPKFYCRNDHG